MSLSTILTFRPCMRLGHSPHPRMSPHPIRRTTHIISLLSSRCLPRIVSAHASTQRHVIPLTLPSHAYFCRVLRRFGSLEVRLRARRARES